MARASNRSRGGQPAIQTSESSPPEGERVGPSHHESRKRICSELSYATDKSYSLPNLGGERSQPQAARAKNLVPISFSLQTRPPPPPHPAFRTWELQTYSLSRPCRRIYKEMKGRDCGFSKMLSAQCGQRMSQGQGLARH